MHHLVFNKNSPYHFYKKSGHLVRTPIEKTFTIYPTAQTNYDVGDAYTLILPTRDFFTTSGDGNYSQLAGHKMRRCYLGQEVPSHDSDGWAQIWRNNKIFSTSTDSGFVFYNGNYSPAMGLMGGAAFMRVCGYKFAVPPEIEPGHDWQVTSLSVTFKDHGIVLTSGNAATQKTNSGQYPSFVQDAPTSLLPLDSNWRSGQYPFNIGVFSLSHIAANEPMVLFGHCQDSFVKPACRTDACDNLGAANGYPFWTNWPSGQVTYVDGHIINAPFHPYVFTTTTNAAFRSAATSLISDGELWISFISDVSDSGTSGHTSQDYPSFYVNSPSGGASNWWLCMRLQIQSIQVTFTVE